MTQPAAAPPVTPTPYAAIGGHDTVKDIARRFYSLVENDPDYAVLRALHGPDLLSVEARLARFLSGWMGGPRDWFDEARGCIFGMHRPIPITPAVAEQWSDAMRRAIAAEPRVDPALGRLLAEALDEMAQAMVNVEPAG